MATENFEDSGSSCNNDDRDDISQDFFSGECCPHGSNCTAIGRRTHNRGGLTANVDDWAAFRIFFRLPQHLMGNRGGISFAKGDVLQ